MIPRGHRKNKIQIRRFVKKNGRYLMVYTTFNLEELVSISTGKINSNESNVNGIYPFFTCAPEPLRINWYSFEADAILLAGNNANGIYHIQRYNGKFNAYQRTYIITTTRTDVSLDYLYYLLKLRLNYLHDVSQGTATKFLTKNILNKISINLPSIEVQDNVAHILTTLENKVKVNKQLNKTLESIAQTLFKHWFIDFEFPDENGQPYKSSGGEMVESEFGEIPKNWEIKKLNQIVDLKIGRTPPTSQKEWFSTNERDIPWISIKDLGNAQTFVTETARFLTEESVDKFKIPLIKSGTVMLSFKLTVGRVAITAMNCISNEAIAQFKIQDQKMSTSYLYLYLKSYDFNKVGSTSSIANATNSKEIGKIPIIVPSKEVFTPETISFETILEKIRINTLENRNLSKIRDLLLPKLMSGKIRVPVRDTND